MSDLALRIVLVRKLFHYAARTYTVVDVPRWLAEGAADSVARPNTAVPVDARLASQTLLSDTDLDTLRGAAGVGLRSCVVVCLLSR